MPDWWLIGIIREGIKSEAPNYHNKTILAKIKLTISMTEQYDAYVSHEYRLWLFSDTQHIQINQIIRQIDPFIHNGFIWWIASV